MSVDPNNTVLAETTFTGEHFAWLDGTQESGGVGAAVG